jgi:hypothetical protein
MRDLLAIPIIRDLCATGCALSFLATAFDVVFVLYCYTPISSGGLSFSVSMTPGSRNPPLIIIIGLADRLFTCRLRHHICTFSDPLSSLSAKHV